MRLPRGVRYHTIRCAHFGDGQSPCPLKRKPAASISLSECSRQLELRRPPPSPGAAVSITAEAPDFDPSIQVECTGGIHFFMTRAEAEAYEC